ncbi:MAG: hypothetical protein V4617_13955 [Gemmatimonadota bacterium]
MHPFRIALIALSCSALVAAGASAQSAPPPAGAGDTKAAPAAAGAAGAAMSEADIRAFAALHVKINALHDSSDAQLAQARNKTLAAQTDLKAKRRKDVAAVIAASGLSDAEYQRRRFLVSTDGETRKVFDVAVAKLTGAPAPGTVVPTTTPVPTIAVPAGPAGVHIGHVVNAFGDTPGGMGLLPVAMAEARIAAQHATLASRAPMDLAAMQLHAGHVIHALDPTIVAMGPGRGYGLKRAAAGVAAHIELAAKAEGAPANVTAHAPHIAASARNTGERVEQIIAIAKRIQAATTAVDAATLIGQLSSLCDGLVAGKDVNSDGRVNWDGGEGGLQQAQEHVNLMLKG